MKKALIFDLDGTLWDSSKEICKIWNQVIGKYKEINQNISLSDVYDFMGKTLDEIIDYLFSNVDRDLITKVLNECCDEEIKYLSAHGANIYKGVEETLYKLSKKYDLYIVSNCQDGYIDAFLISHGLKNLFKDIEMFGRNGKLKAENIVLIMNRNNISDAIYIGDTIMDENASIDAGIPFIHASYGFGKSKKPIGTISSFEELPKVLEEISF